MNMFEKFGEFDSAEELNRAAAAQLAEGNTESVMILAKENGIDKEDAEDYIDGCVPELATPLSAAIGKLEMEAKELNLSGILLDWNSIILQNCTEDEAFCRAVRNKKKNLKDCMAMLIKFAFENKVQISEQIVKATKVMHNGKEEAMRSPLYMGVPNSAEAGKIIKKYYIGQE